MNVSPKSRHTLALIVVFLLSGCAALPLIIPPLVEFGANLLTTAVNNYGNDHKQNMENLLGALQRPTNPFLAQGIVANPYSQPSGQSPPGYPPQDYQTAQGYPSGQEYPSQQPSPQQAYDPYQQNQNAYGGNPPHPSNPTMNQGQPSAPNATYPVYPNQHATPPEYPSYPDNSYPPANQHPPSAPYGQHNPYNQPSHSQDPYGTAGYPQEQFIGVPTEIPISLDVLLVKKHVVNGVPSYLPIKDGDILMDGRGNPQAGDKFRVMFRANTDAYVYVIAVDGSAWAQGLFPSAASPFANPVKTGQQYVLPEGNNWFSLDQFKGIETIFVVASHAPRKDIEHILTTITGRERSPLEKPQAVSEPAIVPNGFASARQAASPFAFRTAQQAQTELLPTTYFVKTAGEDLRITRWFRHQ